jgi:DcmR-like sensory protein
MMTTELRKSGIDVLGDMPWGTHVCLFYETKEDLVDTLVAYCKAGLESQEFCLWVVAEPVREEEARHALKQSFLILIDTWRTAASTSSLPATGICTVARLISRE